MKRLIVATSLALGLAVLSGCYSAPVMPPPGLIYQDTFAPIDTDAQASPAGGMNSGRAEAYSILGLIAMGDASVNAASQNANLTSVEHVDYEFFNILGIYQKFTTIAYGK